MGVRGPDPAARHRRRFIEVISPYTPARGAAELIWGAATDHTPDPVALAAPAGWTVVAALAAAWAHRRDEGRRFT
ncbi:hypothetical protein ABGB18_02940 [Nonomuraea sp. B12E4]|uniref:hypothetical protein n=1 Tax=Nonomuraea sp. B12E4 TaxID=3153564 RepID=UPI00325F52E8